MSQRSATLSLVVNPSGSFYYVRPDGNDANNGRGDSSSGAFKTLQKAANVVAPGDTVLVRAGNYAGFNLATTGTSAGRITFRADPGVVINQPETFGGGMAGINLSGPEYVTVDGFTVQPSGGAFWQQGIRMGGVWPGQPITWARGNVIQNCKAFMRGTAQGSADQLGIFASFQDGIQFLNNQTTGCWDSGMYASNSCKNYVFRGNTVSGCGGNGIHNNGDGGAGPPGINTNALIEQNVIFNCGTVTGGQLISCDGVQDSRIQNNLVYAAHGKGISLYQHDGTGGSTGNVVVNNTFVTDPANGGAAINVGSNCPGNTIFNNLFLTQRPDWNWIALDTSSVSGTGIDANGIGLYQFLTNPQGFQSIPLATWRSTYGFDVNSQQMDGTWFVSLAGNNYRLVSGKGGFALASFRGFAAPTVDLTGATRSAPRCGCYV